MTGVLGPSGSIFYNSVWHYGDPFGEQFRLLNHGGYVVDKTVATLRVTGEDTLPWLNTLSSQLLLDMKPDQVAQSLFLDTHGRIEHHIWIYPILGEAGAIAGAYLETSAAHITALYEYLTKMIFWSKVTVDQCDVDTIRILHSVSTPAPEHTIATREILWNEAYVRTVLCQESETNTVCEELAAAGYEPIGLWAYEAYRIAAASPRADLDYDIKTLPHEMNLIGSIEQGGAVHLTKGCYRGQETISRIHNLGKPPRRLVLLHLETSRQEGLASGEAITANGKTVGSLGSSIDHAELGTIALGLVKRNTPVETQLATAGLAARIDPDFYYEDEGIPAGRAAILRLQGKL